MGIRANPPMTTLSRSTTITGGNRELSRLASSG